MKKQQKHSKSGYQALRSRLWKNHPDKFESYADTAAAASFIYSKAKNRRNKGVITNKYLSKQARDYQRKLAETERLVEKYEKRKVKKKRKKAAPEGIPEAPRIPGGLLGEFAYFELDQKVHEVKDFGFNDYFMSSPISKTPSFLLKSYNYESSFQDYVNYYNLHRDHLDDYEPYLYLGFDYDHDNKRYVFFITEVEATGYSITTTPPTPPKRTPPIAGEEKPGEKKAPGPTPPSSSKEYEEMLKQTEFKTSEMKRLVKLKEELQKQEVYYFKQLKKYKKIGDKVEVAKIMSSLADTNDAIRDIGRQLGKLGRK